MLGVILVIIKYLQNSEITHPKNQNGSMPSVTLVSLYRETLNLADLETFKTCLFNVIRGMLLNSIKYCYVRQLLAVFDLYNNSEYF